MVYRHLTKNDLSQNFPGQRPSELPRKGLSAEIQDGGDSCMPEFSRRTLSWD